MKKQLSLLVLVLFILSGCTVQFLDKNENVATSQLLEKQQELQIKGSVDIMNEMMMEKEGVRKKITCDMLGSDNSKKECENMISETAESMLSSEIRRTFDIARCDMLSSWNADSCKSRIEKSGIKGPITEQEIKDLRVAQKCTYKKTENRKQETGNEEPMDMIKEMMMEEEGECVYDVSKCGVLTTTGLKEYCEGKVNNRIEEEKVWKIVEAGDSAKCDTLKTDNAKDSCKMQLGVYDEEKDMMEEMMEK